MNWFDILKNARLSGKTEGTTGTLDTTQININTDDNCKKELFNWLKIDGLHWSNRRGTDWDISEKSCCELIKWIKSTTFPPALQYLIDMDEKEFARYVDRKEPTIYIGVFNSTDKDIYAELTIHGNNTSDDDHTFLTLRLRASVDGYGYDDMLKSYFDYRDFMHWDSDMPQEAYMKKLWEDIRFEW
tara:strand:+ start:1145 stop:1702 length:558 start_codon:yes stop_codon:yes gene_type:complete